MKIWSTNYQEEKLVGTKKMGWGGLLVAISCQQWALVIADYERLFPQAFAQFTHACIYRKKRCRLSVREPTPCLL